MGDLPRGSFLFCEWPEYFHNATKDRQCDELRGLLVGCCLLSLVFARVRAQAQKNTSNNTLFFGLTTWSTPLMPGHQHLICTSKPLEPLFQTSFVVIPQLPFCILLSVLASLLLKLIQLQPPRQMIELKHKVLTSMAFCHDSIYHFRNLAHRTCLKSGSPDSSQSHRTVWGGIE